MNKKFIVEKQDTATTTEYYDDTDTAVDELFSTTASHEDSERYVVTRKKQLSIEEIKSRLQGFVLLQGDELKVLERLPIFKTWVRYITKETMQYHHGALLMKVEYPTYIVLSLPEKKFNWSVQLKDNYIFVRDPKITLAREEQRKKEIAIKEKLYELYTKGELVLRK